MIRWLKVTIFCLALCSTYAQAAIVVIVNTDNPVNNFTQRQLVDLYMGRNLYFPDGRLAIRLDQSPGSSIREEFYQQLVGKTVAEVNAYWARLLFTGRASPPQVMNNSERVIEAVTKNKNAIGYVRESELVDTVKVVGRVDEGI